MDKTHAEKHAAQMWTSFQESATLHGVVIRSRQIMFLGKFVFGCLAGTVEGINNITAWVSRVDKRLYRLEKAQRELATRVTALDGQDPEDAEVESVH